jgi:hypothetical protein
MGEVFETAEAEGAAAPLDGMSEVQIASQQVGILWPLLQRHQLDIEHGHAFVGLCKEFLQHVFHQGVS